MPVKLPPYSLSSSSTSNIHSSNRDTGDRLLVTVSNTSFFYHCISNQRCRVRKRLSESEKHIISSRELSHNWSLCQKRKRFSHLAQLASMDDGVTVNGTPQTSSSSDVQEMMAKLSQSLQADDHGIVLIQSLHDAARAIELAVINHSSSSKTSWFSNAWLGVDRNAWVKTLSYQVAVHSLLQAAIEISPRDDGRNRDTNAFIEKSLMRLSAPLESLIREELSAKQPGAYDWFWSLQHPSVVTSFVNILESNPRYITTTTIWKGMPTGPGSTSDLSLLKLALNCIAAVTKLGPAKVSCTQFFSMVPDITGSLMDMVLDFVPMLQGYSLIKEIGLHREFLLHFGPRAAKSRVSNEQGVEEITFWVDLVQKQLQQAIDRERIWSRLTTCESIEVLEKDLAIFGFFIALGRSTQVFLSSNGISVADYMIESIIRYFIGGSVLYYPQLSSISSYQLYVEVVCEELDWLPFYGTKLVAAKLSHEKTPKTEGLSQDEVVLQVLDVCSHWTNSFIKYSLWLEDPSNIKAASFLSRGHHKLNEYRKELGAGRIEAKESLDDYKLERTRSDRQSADRNLDSFEKSLESVEEAINRLETLLQELHLSNSRTGKEHLEAACSDLQKIRKLKKEAEFLEVSFRAKAASLEEDSDDDKTQFSTRKRRQYSTRGNKKTTNKNDDGGISADSKYGGLWSFLSHHTTKKMEPELLNTPQNEDEVSQQVSTSGNADENSEVNEIRRFEVLKRELIELEKRVQRNNEETTVDKERTDLDNRMAGSQKLVVQAPKKENIVAKSIEKLKETSTDVWQGTQLLAIDTAAAILLIKRALTGDDLAEKEKQALRRTLTDLASVVPIGILMLLPVTAVGHAAMLAAIQRYVPALIPSTYAPERLDLLRQLEKVKEIESGEMKPDDNEPQTA